ncbi:tail fiber protein, partial [Escherichia coli]
GTLDTLKEIAAAINNDPNFSTTINNSLALKAPLASPAFTGTPTAPTASQGTNSTQIANTAFVKAAITALINGAPGTLDTLKEIAA